MSGVKSTLKDVASNAVREIPVDAIEEDGPRDRFSFTDADVATLANSIRDHGQQVPVMVRPVPDKPGYYRIVYGRRRLRALRVLGLPAKALVRSLSDEEAVLAQGQENAQRLDPSFIEKALFAASLGESGYSQEIILDALAIDKPMLSRMTKVARAIPEAVIRFIGSAHGVGRRRWDDLAELMRDHAPDLETVLARPEPDILQTSEDRFAMVHKAASQQLRNQDTNKFASVQSVTLADGTPLAEIRETARAMTFKLSKTNAPEFTRWMRSNAETELKRLYEEWQSAQDSDESK